MAEEGTLGLARVHELERTDEPLADDLSKAELQRKLEETRDSISQTVSDIKDTVAHQVQTVKETLDWREQFKRRPVAWSVGALGVGFLAGYGIAAALKGRGDDYASAIDYYGEQSRAYASGPILGEAALPASNRSESAKDQDEPGGAGVFTRLANTAAYDKVKHEAQAVGDLLISELGNTAKALVVPAVVKTIKDFLGDFLPKSSPKSSVSTAPRSESSAYQPKLERDQP